MSTAKRLDGKVALITGGTSGIGLATARLFARQGARVAVTGSSERSIAAARDTLGKGALVIRSNTADLGDIDRLAGDVREHLGALDILFVNAGVARFAPIESTDAELVDLTFGVNFRGAYFTIQKLLPLLRDGGSIVLNTSVVNQKGFPNTSAYAASKAALRSLARSLSAELAPRGIRVNAVSPGPIETPIYSKLGLPADELAAFAAEVTAKVPQGRFGTADEIASAVLFLASDDSSYIAGSEIAVDGGLAQV
jgi:NAD(P)-dependent dehydrogenase (short-subunit alcohol dehydrogenase family)